MKAAITARVTALLEEHGTVAGAEKVAEFVMDYHNAMHTAASLTVGFVMSGDIPELTQQVVDFCNANGFDRAEFSI